jgi:hypothetical protein
MIINKNQNKNKNKKIFNYLNTFDEFSFSIRLNKHRPNCKIKNFSSFYNNNNNGNNYNNNNNNNNNININNLHYFFYFFISKFWRIKRIQVFVICYST